MEQIVKVDGQDILLNTKENRADAEMYQYANELMNHRQYQNATGYEVDITTLTGIIKSVTEQKFFEIAPSDFMPIQVGEFAFTTDILKYSAQLHGADFEAGDVDMATGQARLNSTDVSVQSNRFQKARWAWNVDYNIFDIKQANKTGVINLVTEKERARKKIWDLGIQKVAFLGKTNNSDVKGLLNQTGVTSNTALITKYIKAMNATEFQTFLSGLMAAYRSNANFTAYPNMFEIPEVDFLGLCVAPDETYPVKTKLQRIKECLPGVTVKPCAYGDKARNTAVINKNRYVLYNNNRDSMTMYIDVPYTPTSVNTQDGFNFKNVAYGEYSGLNLFRPLEMLYFDWS
jgi:hypothetical protein